MLEIYRQFIKVLRCGVCKDALPMDSLDWDEILRLARIHRVEAIVWHALRDRENVPTEIQKKLNEHWSREIVRDMRQDHAAEQVRRMLESREISFAPMKGLVLKHDYPFPHMRYMSDLDFYIQSTERNRIQSCMGKLGAKISGTDSGDVNYEMPGQIQIEFHGCLLYRTDSTGVVCYSDWSRMKIGENCLTEEGYALNLIGHVAYNIAHAGCGVRFILDLWIYRHRHTPQPDWATVMQQLRTDGLGKIAENLLELSEYWFGEGEATPLLDELGMYIFESGLYGLSKRRMLSDIGVSGGKLYAIRSHIFRSKDEFQNRYPWLKKYPYMLPIAWGMRGAQSLKFHHKEIGKWVKGLNQSSQKEIKEHGEQLKRFGISSKR